MGDQPEEPPPGLEILTSVYSITKFLYLEATPPQTEEITAVEPPSPDVKPSKSVLVDKRASTMSKQVSRVKLVEPGEETAVHEDDRKKSEINEKRKSVEEERRQSEAARRSRQISVGSGG